MVKSKKTAVILCGGLGSRLGALANKLPKSLVRVHGFPILWYIINILKNNAFNHLILPVGYKGKKIQNFIKKNKIFKKMNIDIIDTGVNTSIAKRIFYIKDKIQSKNFLLLNGDAIFDFSVKDIFQKHEKTNRDLSFIGCEVQLPYGTVGLKGRKIVSFNRNLTFNSVNVKDKRNFLAHVYSGMSVINKKLLYLNFKNFKNFEKDFYPKIIKKKYNCGFETFNGFWHSIDNMKDIEETKKSTNKNKYLLINKIKRKLNEKR